MKSRPRRRLTESTLSPAQRHGLLSLVRDEYFDIPAACAAVGVALSAIDPKLMDKLNEAFGTATSLLRGNLLRGVLASKEIDPAQQRFISQQILQREQAQAQTGSNGSHIPWDQFPDDFVEIAHAVFRVLNSASQRGLGDEPLDLSPVEDLVNDRVSARLLALRAEQAEVEPEEEVEPVKSSKVAKPRRAKSSRRLKREAQKKSNVIPMPVAEQVNDQKTVYWSTDNSGIAPGAVYEELTPPARLVKADQQRMFERPRVRGSSTHRDSAKNSTSKFLNDHVNLQDYLPINERTLFDQHGMKIS